MLTYYCILLGVLVSVFTVQMIDVVREPKSLYARFLAFFYGGLGGFVVAKIVEVSA